MKLLLAINSEFDNALYSNTCTMHILSIRNIKTLISTPPWLPTVPPTVPPILKTAPSRSVCCIHTFNCAITKSKSANLNDLDQMSSPDALFDYGKNSLSENLSESLKEISLTSPSVPSLLQGYTVSVQNLLPVSFHQLSHSLYFLSIYIYIFKKKI